MDITEVKVYPTNEKKVKAYCSVVFDECFVIRDIKVIDGDKRLFVAMPNKTMKDGSHRDTAHPLTGEMRQKLESAVLDEYKKEMGEVLQYGG